MSKIIQFKDVKKRREEPRASSVVDLTPAFYAFQAYALQAFCQAVAELRHHERIPLPDNFVELMQNPDGILPLRTYGKILKLPPKKKQMLIYTMVSAVHDGWVRDNPQFFFDSKQAEGRFLFLRIELCGIEVYRRFMGEILTTIKRLGLETPRMALDADAMYKEKRHQFVRKHKLSNATLAEYITNIGQDYVALGPEISSALRNSPILAGEIASQVILRAPLGGIEFC